MGLASECYKNKYFNVLPVPEVLFPQHGRDRTSEWYCGYVMITQDYIFMCIKPVWLEDTLECTGEILQMICMVISNRNCLLTWCIQFLNLCAPMCVYEIWKEISHTNMRTQALLHTNTNSHICRLANTGMWWDRQQTILSQNSPG